MPSLQARSLGPSAESDGACKGHLQLYRTLSGLRKAEQKIYYTKFQRIFNARSLLTAAKCSPSVRLKRCEPSPLATK